MSFTTYLKNIQEKTGISPDEFINLATKKNFMIEGNLKSDVKAGQIIQWLKEDYALGHGHATAMYAYFKGKRN